MDYKVQKLCEKVENLTADLNLLIDDGHARTGHAVIVRMKLTLATTELMYEDLMDRIRISRPACNSTDAHNLDIQDK